MTVPADTPALVDGRRNLRVREMDACVDAERAWLAALGAPGSRFALLADNGIPWALTDLALHRARVLNVPLPAYFVATQIEHALDDTGIDVLLTDDPARVEGAHPQWQRTRQSPGSGLVAFARRGALEAHPPLPAGTTKITYTSGSTGTPRGVCLSAAAIERVARSLADVTRPLGVTRHLCLLPLATLLDNLAGLIAAPMAGAACVVAPAHDTGVAYGRVDLPKLLGCISRHEPGSMILVPELLRLLLAGIGQGWRPPASLRFVAVGGAAVAPELLDRAAALGLPVFQGYGLSECTSVLALNAPGANRTGSVGRVLPHAQVRVDRDGEIHVRGAVMLGYLGETASDEIATGDLGRLDADGYLYVSGRRKNLMITSLGRNLSPEWLERELLAQPEIGQAVAFGDGRPHPIALLVPSRPGLEPAAVAAAVAAANARLPESAQVRRWALVRSPFTAADGSLTANGRPKRDVIAARYAAEIDSLFEQALAS